ncbi:L,D-transpeptidase family protein [Methyloceanibacter sp.]|uniref:L,D-transpeptidase family protein n=1 Tax=Methyloceanibacter sp. TaxID=1965321 RepID=UPI003D6CFD3F
MRPFSCIAFALFLAAPLTLGPLTLAAHAAEPESPDALIGQTEAVRAAVQERLTAKFTNASETRKNEQGALVEYYSVAENRLLWVGEQGLNDRAKSVMEEIGKADEYGLRPADYPLPKAGDETPDAKWLADAEIKISFAVLGYARDARGGRIDPLRLSPNLDPTLALPDPMEVIESIAFRSDPASYLRSFQPDQPQFEALRQALIAARGGNPDKDVVRIPDGPTLELGVDHEQVALLRKRLNVAVEDGGKETVFDASVHAAVQRFQEDHGVLPDGAVGPGTRRLLNQQHHEAANPGQVRLILLNMERWRWLPHDLGSFYVNVNIPEFTVRVMGDGKAVHTARVVVGKPDKQTPIISKEMQEIVFNPYWNVPNSIKTEEIRPFLVEEGGWFGGGGWNTAVLERHNLRINIGGREVDPSRIDWNHIDIRSLNIYQPPGPDNVLGTVKFVFPNSHDVYMHDTTQKALFAKTVRAESHGCMRVQNPDQLALTLLKEDQGWSAGRVASAIQGGPDQHIALKEKIPVYITYFTLRVNDDGSISTFGDIYGHDSRMAAALRL